MCHVLDLTIAWWCAVERECAPAHTQQAVLHHGQQLPASREQPQGPASQILVRHSITIIPFPFLPLCKVFLLTPSHGLCLNTLGQRSSARACSRSFGASSPGKGAGYLAPLHPPLCAARECSLLIFLLLTYVRAEQIMHPVHQVHEVADHQVVLQRCPRAGNGP
jgi:hypothetical protein